MHRQWVVVALCALTMLPNTLRADGAVEELIVVATRQQQPRIEIPYAVHRVDREQIESRLYRTLPQALREIPSVMVQETAPGQGSPFIRGFTGFRTLFLIDGVRLNNSVFREGPNQYSSTIDLQGIESIEVLGGPSSVLYGSDAVGGTVAINTVVASEDAVMLNLRQSSAEHSTSANLRISEVDTLLGDLSLSATSRNFGSLRLGDDLGTQHGVGHQEWNGELKWNYATEDGWLFSALHQQLRQTDVPRVHVLAVAKPFSGTARGTDLQRDLDQERRLTYVRAGKSNLGPFDSATLTLSHVATNETEDRIRANNRRDITSFDVDTVGVQVEATHSGWVYGAEYYRDLVDSVSNRNPIQGPVADDSSYGSFGVFVQNRFDLTEQAHVIAGLRHTRVNLHAGRAQDPRTGAAVSIEEDYDATVGTLRGHYEWIPSRLSTFVGVSQGFRAPNLSDLTRLDSARSGERETSGTDLDPERFVSVDTGAKYLTDTAGVQLTYYRTFIDELIQRFPTGRVIDNENEVSKRNVGEGHVEGVEVATYWNFAPGLSAFANASWQDGEIDRFGPTSSQVEKDKTDRIMPLTFNLGLTYAPTEQWWISAELMHARDADDISRFDALDTSRIPPGGTPDYTVVHLGGGYRIAEGIELNLAVDNVANEDYRVHGSGTNMPGRNFIIGVNAAL